MSFTESDVFYMGKMINFISKTPSVTPTTLVVGKYRQPCVNTPMISLHNTKSAFSYFLLRYLQNLLSKSEVHLLKKYEMMSGLVAHWLNS